MDLQAKSPAERSYVRRSAEPVSQLASTAAVVDSPPGAVALRKLSDTMHGSQRMAAQRSLAEAMHDAPRAVAQRRANRGMSFPVQRVVSGVPQSVIYTPAALSPAARTRLQSVVDTLVTALDNDPAIQIGMLIVSVEREGGLDYGGGASAIAGDNPALTRTIPRAPNPSDIEITIQRPFAEAATEGEMLGLLAHEVGVHNIPSDFLGINDFAVTAFAPIQTPRKIAKGNTPSGGYEFQNWPAAAVGAAWHGGRQHDHLMVADIMRNPPAAGGVAPLTRANVYFQTVLNIGDTIDADANKTAAQKTILTGELIHIYLVDVARIIASDDNRMPPASHGLAINDVYGELFNQVVLPYQATHPWIPNSRPKGNAFTLAASLAAFLARVKFEKQWNG